MITAIVVVVVVLEDIDIDAMTVIVTVIIIEEGYTSKVVNSSMGYRVGGRLWCRRFRRSRASRGR